MLNVKNLLIMKRSFVTVLLSILTTIVAFAQFDDRFYFPAREMNEIKDFKYEEFIFDIDTVSLYSVLIYPESRVKGTIFFYHGSGGNITTYLEMVRPLVKAGFQVHMVDFRGYGKSTGKPTHLNIATDAQHIIETMIEENDIAGLPVIIYGASIGTQVATKIAKDNQEQVDGLILDGAMSSFTDIAVLSVPEEQRQMIAQYLVCPYAAKEDIKEISKVPKLIIHSRQDSSVPFAQGELIFENAHEPKLFWKYEGEHLQSAILYPDTLLQKIELLLN